MTGPNADFDELVFPATGARHRNSGPRGPVQPDGPRPRHPLTRIDAWWGRMLRTPFRQSLWAWGGPAVVTVVAAVLRLWHLGSPHALVFDETFYVKDAYTMLHLGYEGSWPADADTKFNAGDVDIFTSAGSYVAHPPLGKWIISLGLRALGGQSAVGWRISTVLVGVLAVIVLMLIAKKLFHSTALATLAGGLFAIDGHAIVLSRTALLDNYVMMFTLLGFGAILLDRGHAEARLAVWIARRKNSGRSIDWGPALWARPWLITAGLMFGLATAVKWSGLYFIAAFAVYSVVVDALARRRAGVTFWTSGTVFKQAPVTFLLVVPVALAAYLASWTGWFATQGGYYRQWANEPGNAASGAFAWVPHSLQSFWHYQQSVYDFNVNEHQFHSYAASPFTWLLMIRPTAFYYQGTTQGQSGCTYSSCAQYITSVANPLIWYASVAALVFLVYRLVRYREWKVGLILMGLVAGYLPWLLYSDRTIFQFYAIVFEPYMILALVFTIGVLIGKRTDPPWQRTNALILVAIFIVLSVLLSAFFYPVWTGATIPTWFANLHYWFPGWR